MTAIDKLILRLQKTFFVAGYVAACTNLAPRKNTATEVTKAVTAGIAEYNKRAEEIAKLTEEVA